MGLNFSHTDARWSYSGFMNFRIRLAAEIDVPLLQMEGFGNRRYGKPDYKPGWRSWDNVDDPIKPLLHHSDCDGVLTPEECRQVAPRLRELVSDWEDGYDKRMALKLADAMDKCAESGEDLEFL